MVYAFLEHAARPPSRGALVALIGAGELNAGMREINVHTRNWD
jgi:hypothetical protein